MLDDKFVAARNEESDHTLLVSLFCNPLTHTDKTDIQHPPTNHQSILYMTT